MEDNDEDKTNLKDLKKKAKAKDNKKDISLNNQEENKQDKVDKKEEFKEKNQEASNSKEAPPEIRLEELLGELNLIDKSEETNPEDEEFVEDFISKLERVKVEK